MASDNYEACLAITLKWEGGDVDHPADPGGKTRWGITQGTYDGWRARMGKPRRSVFSMERWEMLAIYKANYWDAVKGDTLARGVDLATWDYGVNSGPARARKALLAVVGGSDVDTVKKLCAARMSFVKGLSTWKVFGRGWSNRIADIEARGVKMALTGNGVKPSDARTAMLEESQKAAKSAGNNAAASGTSGGGAAVAGTVTDADQIAALVSFGSIVVVCLALAAFFYFRSRHQRDRAVAYRTVAGE